MRFSIFLQEKHEGTNRTKAITKKKLKELLSEYNEDELRNILGSSDKFNKFYRGDKLNKSIGFISPKLSRRFSPYAANNFYNLYLSNSNDWSAYPKREYSVIGSTGYGKASSYAVNEPFILIPIKKNAKIGIAPADDIWDSFLKKLGDLNKINKMVGRAASIINKNYSGWDENWEKTLDILKSFNKDALKGLGSGQIDSLFEDFPMLKMLMKRYDSLYDALEDRMSPKDNGFSVVTFDKFLTGSYGNKEVWTDEDCVMIKVTDSIDILYELTKGK
jgi:hypothetical protein